MYIFQGTGEEEQKMIDKVYALLATKGYSFKEYPDKRAARFRSYADAFNAAMDIENSFIKVSAGQDNKWLYFGPQEELPPDPDIGECIEVEEADDEEDYDEVEEGGHVDFDSIMTAFCMYHTFYYINRKKKFKANKVIFFGDPDTIVRNFYDFYDAIGPHPDKVQFKKKKNKVIFRPAEGQE
jgi:hypothetical protein